ncbi:MAG: dihydromethanopterin reductase (acceptor) [Candidatus Baldrarchaeia archaeon]
MKRVAWGITGGGQFLLETFEVFRWAVKNLPIKVTIFISKAGEEVARMYGIWNRLSEVSDGSYYSEIIRESEQGSSFPKIGRFSLRMYNALIVAPATSNTIAKIVHGISDTLITAAVSQAIKADTPVYILPTDIGGRYVDATLPLIANRDICRGCEDCPPLKNCPTVALKVVEGKITVDLQRCIGCKICVNLCKYGALSFGMKVKTKVRDVEIRNLRKLSRMEGITVLESPSRILEILKSL